MRNKEDSRPELDKFLFHSSTKILLVLRKFDQLNMTMVSRKSDITYKYTLHAIRRYAKLGCIEVEKIGRSSSVRLTGKGRRIADYLYKIRHAGRWKNGSKN